MNTALHFSIMAGVLANPGISKTDEIIMLIKRRDEMLKSQTIRTFVESIEWPEKYDPEYEKHIDGYQHGYNAGLAANRQAVMDALEEKK